MSSVQGNLFPQGSTANNPQGNLQEAKKLINLLINKLHRHIVPMYSKHNYAHQQSNSILSEGSSSSTTIINDYSYTPLYIHNDTYHYSSSNSSGITDDDDAVQSTVGGIIIGGIAIIAGTYLVATDLYQNISAVDLDTDISSVSKFIHQSTNLELMGLMSIVEKSYETWKEEFIRRTYHIRTSKVTATAAGAAVGFGLWWGSAAVMTGGAIGLVGSACVFIWKYFSSDEKISEEEAFESVLLGLIKLQSELDKLINPIQIPISFPYAYGTPLSPLQPIYYHTPFTTIYPDNSNCRYGLNGKT